MHKIPISGPRATKYALTLIEKYQIDCTGLTILTEAASGAYLYNPMIPVLANAKRVITFCRDSKYATTHEVHNNMEDVYRDADLLERYDFCTTLSQQIISTVDIVTNSGHLRPFDENFFNALKSTAVLPLMWEPWEMRPGEIDINAAKRNHILILGTNEHQPPCDLRPYSFLTALHLVMSHKAAITDDRILIIGEQFSLALPIEDGFLRIGINCRQISPSVCREEAEEAVRWATYILVAEHADHRCLIGPGALIETEVILQSGITGVGVVSGLVNRYDLEKKGVSVYPSFIAPPGYMSYLPSELGPYPVMDLFAAGIKVGQTMARARLEGLSVGAAAKLSLDSSPAMDLDGEMAWT